MNGYLYSEAEPTELCPYCANICHADFTDIGVGMTQCGPYHCDLCEATQRGPYDEERELTDLERKTGWYAPGSPKGSSVNVIDGKVVSHGEMRDVYREAFVGNDQWSDSEYMEKWWRDIRQMHPISEEK